MYRTVLFTYLHDMKSKKKVPKVYKLLGEKLRSARQLEAMTQKQVADAVGLPREAIVAIESGTYGNVSLDKFVKLALAVDSHPKILAHVIFSEL